MDARGGRDELERLLRDVPEGWSRATVRGEAWGVSRVSRARGRSLTFTAERLGASDRLSANIWITADGPVLKPCEVPADSVVDFLRALAAEAPTTGARIGDHEERS